MKDYRGDRVIRSSTLDSIRLVRCWTMNLEKVRERLGPLPSPCRTWSICYARYRTSSSSYSLDVTATTGALTLASLD